MNNINGTIPQNARWNWLEYLDLSYNQMVGTFPVEWVDNDQMTRIRSIYMDHNQFYGELPEDLFDIASGRLMQLLLSDNRFTGDFPGDYKLTTFMQQLELQNNN